MAIEVLTGVLVLVPGYYAWQNRAMVQEMRRARGAQLMPKLVPLLRLIGGGHALPRLQNVGPGPALEVDVEFRLEPGGPVRRWASSVVTSGETHDFFVKEEGVDLVIADQLVEKYAEFVVEGSCKNALGEAVRVNERINIREIWELAKSSQHLQPQEGPVEKRLKEVKAELDGIGKVLNRIAQTIAARDGEVTGG